MSLWYDSLGMALYDCGDNTAEKVKCILAHLSMHVPRSWWEHALQTGDVRSWAPVIRDLQVELSTSIDLSECFRCHPCGGRDPGISTNNFLDSAKASLRVQGTKDMIRGAFFGSKTAA